MVAEARACLPDYYLILRYLSYSSDATTLTGLVLVLSAHALNKSCHVPGRKHTLNKCYVPNRKVCLITRVYRIEQLHLQIFCSVTRLPEMRLCLPELVCSRNVVQ